MSRREMLRRGGLAIGCIALSGSLGPFFLSDEPVRRSTRSFDVLAFGADPTGSSDSAETINRALSAAASRGPLLVPAGTYLLNTWITVPSNTQLIMHPQATLVRNHTDATIVNLARAALGPKVFRGRGDSNITIVGGRFVLSASRPVGEHLVFAQVTNLSVRSVHVGDTTGGGYMMWLTNVYNAAITNCVLDNPDMFEVYNDGIHIESGRSISIRDCYVRTGDDAVALGNLAAFDELRDVTVANCILRSGRGRGLAIYTQGARQVYAIAVSNVSCSSDSGGGSVLVADYYNDNDYAAMVVADMPVVYYRLKETAGASASDSSGNGRAAIISPGGVEYAQRGGLRSDLSPDPRTFDPGHNYDNCFAFDGIQGAVSRSNLQLSGRSFSFECLLKTTADTTLPAPIIDMGVVGLYLLRGAVRLSDSNGRVVESARAVNDGAWHHVVASYESTTATATVYVDNVAVGSSVGQSFATPVVGSLGIAANGLGGRLAALLDEVAVYDHALQSSRIAAHYNVAMRPRLVHDISLRAVDAQSQPGATVRLNRCSGVTLDRVRAAGGSIDVVDAEGVRLEGCEVDADISLPGSGLVNLDTVGGVDVVGGIYAGGASKMGIHARFVTGGSW